MIKDLENGYVAVGVKKEDLEESIAGLSQLKPFLQAQVIKGNGKNKRQAEIDSKELGKHFDTAITVMTMMLGAFEEERNKDERIQ